jgi:hypothetical protein
MKWPSPKVAATNLSSIPLPVKFKPELPTYQIHAASADAGCMMSLAEQQLAEQQTPFTTSHLDVRSDMSACTCPHRVQKADQGIGLAKPIYSSTVLPLCIVQVNGCGLTTKDFGDYH